jgi:hypothetical protein
MKRLWPWMYHFSLELRQKVSSERKFQRPGTRQKQKFWKPCLRWDRPHVDLFATSLNHKLETFVSPVPDPLSFAVDAMSLSWDGMFCQYIEGPWNMPDYQMNV